MPHTNVRDWETCRLKVKHLTMEAAERAARERTHGRDAGPRMRGYLCRVCKRFHVGHKPEPGFGSIKPSRRRRHYPWS